MPDLRDLPPVEQNVDRPEKLSQTFLARTDVCPRSAMLYVQNGGGVASHALARGSLFHDFAARAVDIMVEQGEKTIPADLCRELMESVMEERVDLVVPTEERDALRGMAWNFGNGFFIEPERVVAVEKMLELDLDGVTIRGRVDLALAYPDAHHAHIIDHKTSFAVTPQGEYEKSWQPRFYALLLLEGKDADDPVGIGSGIDTVTVAELYPRYKQLAEVKTTLSRQEVVDFRHDVRAVIARAEHGFDSGEWPAVPGDHCSTCPMPTSCPLPEALIPAAVEDLPEALAEREMFLDAERKRVMKKLKGLVDQDGPILVGDFEYGFTLTESERLADKDGAKLAIEAGGGDPASYFKTSASTRFGRRKV